MSFDFWIFAVVAIACAILWLLSGWDERRAACGYCSRVVSIAPVDEKPGLWMVEPHVMPDGEHWCPRGGTLRDA